MSRHIWTEQEEALLCRAYATTPTRELAARLSPHTGHLSLYQVYNKARSLGLKKSARFMASEHSGRIKAGMLRVWTKEKESILRRDYPDTPTRELAARLGLTIKQVYHKARCMNLKKSAAFRTTIESGCFRTGHKIGLSNRFQVGNAPFNKGRAYHAVGRSAETHYRAGHIPHNTMPTGAVMTDSSGYLKQKIADNHWEYVHRLVWEKAHGPIPDGHIVIFKDGDKSHIALDNLACISQRENMQRNAIHRYPDELKKTILAVAKLNKIIEDKQP